MVSLDTLMALYDGRCTVWECENVTGDFGCLSECRMSAVASDLPCHLTLNVAGAAKAGAGPSAVEAAGKLFLAADCVIKPGSRLEVIQRGHRYRLECSGEPKVYALHQEIAVALLDELA
ncbi:MAG: hypothetical protein IJE29_01085 [Firmicutes bacterium]|nr:hypothetical protein [Bacillota bacterium]